MVKPLPNTPQPLHGTKEATIPLDMLVNQIVKDLFMVFAGNGYRNLGFALLVQDLSGGDDQPMCMSGNLKPDGMKPLLENALSIVEGEDSTKTPKIIIQ